MSALVTALVLGGLGLGGFGAGLWSSKGGGKQKYNLSDYSDFGGALDADDLAVWQSLSDSERRAIIDKFYSEDNTFKDNLWGIFGPDRETIDQDRLLEALRELSEMQAASKELPERPDSDALWKEAEARANRERDAALAELEGLRQFQVDNFNDELSSLASSYNTSRNAILSSQYQQNAQLDWNPGSGVTGWGKNLGALWTYGDAAVQGVKAFKGFQDNSEVRDSIGDLQSDIVLSAANSPTIWHDLNADQRDLLRQLQRGTYESKGDIGDVDGLGVLGDAAMGALAGLPGGIPGAIIGAVGGGINSVIDDIGNSANRDAAELEALYQAVLDSEQYHNQKRKQQAYAGLY